MYMDYNNKNVDERKYIKRNEDNYKREYAGNMLQMRLCYGIRFK